jgi:hypothetical protein
MSISDQPDIYKLVQSRKAEFSSLYARMDADRAYTAKNTARVVFSVIPAPLGPHQ